MNVSLIIYLGLMAVALLYAANQHGKEKTGEYNFWHALISVAIQIGLLWIAGVFKLL